MAKITVIDAMTGLGKTSWAIQEMRDPANAEKRYVYCTPYIKETIRIKAATSGARQFYLPDDQETLKIEDFNNLLVNRRDIALTHSCFSNATDETKELIRDGHYALILDEVLDVIESLEFEKDDVRLLLDGGYITIDDFDRAHWDISRHYPKSKYKQVEQIARSGNLICSESLMLAWEFPSDIFDCFDNVFIMTYLFAGSLLKPYLEYHKLPYDMQGLTQIDGKYQLCGYSPIEDRTGFRKLINIEQGLNHYEDTQLSSTGLDRFFNGRNNPRKPKKHKKQLKGESPVKVTKNTPLDVRIKADGKNYFRNICKAKTSDIMWTTKKAYKEQLMGEGYSYYTDNAKPSKRIECFVSLSARATNEYSNRHCLAYFYNFHVNPMFNRYFEKRNGPDGMPITVNDDLFALANLIQWTFRSAVRNGEPIRIYLASPRMKKLFTEWLNEGI